MCFVQPWSHVLFKSAAHHGLFITQNSLLDLPGCSVGVGESYAAAALRGVQEQLGSWPTDVSADLSQAYYQDVGKKRYFFVDVGSLTALCTYIAAVLDSFQVGYHIIPERHGPALTDIAMHHIGELSARHELDQVRHEVLRFFCAMRQQNLLSGAACESVDTLGHFFDEHTREAVAAAAANPAVPDQRRRPCGMCGTTRKQLRGCWECDAWACSDCSFWCTPCPRGPDKYNICIYCHMTGFFLLKYGPREWRCRDCR